MQQKILNEAPYELQKLLGFTLTEWREGYARIELPVTERLGNRTGRVHGGVIATLIDASCGFAGTFPSEPGLVPRCVTLTYSSNFVGPATGDKIFVDAELLGGGRKVFFARGVVTNEDGSLVATGEGSFRRLAPDKQEEVLK